MGIEKLEYGQFSPTKEEMKKAREQGPEAEKRLKEKIEKANARLKVKQSEKTEESLEKEAGRQGL